MPAAWPMMKHGPDTRADDWPSCDIDAQRPATKRLSTFCGTMIRYGISLKPRESFGANTNFTSPLMCASTGHPWTPIVSAKSRQPKMSSSVSRYSPSDAPRLADADLRRDLDDVGLLEARRAFLDELEHVPALLAAFDLAVRKLARVDAADGRAARVLDLREVGAPLDRVALRPNDRLLARKRRPRFSASSMSFGTSSHARPALTGSTPLMRNIVDG